MCHADGVTTGISAGCAKGVQLAEPHRGDAAFFVELTERRSVKVFVGVDEPTRERPMAGKRRVFALHEEDVEGVVVQPK